MARRPGPRPKLSVAAIRRVLRWHIARERFLKVHGTASQLAQELGVSTHAFRRAVSLRKSTPQLLMLTDRGRAGRLPQLEAAKFATVQRWSAAHRRFKATHPTAEELAIDLGVSRFVIFDCIRRGGNYRKGTRSQPTANSGEAPRRTLSIRKSYRGKNAETAVRAALLRQWRSPSMNVPSKKRRRVP